MSTCSVVRDFLDYLDAEKGYSPRTRQAYASDLSQFLEFAQLQGVEFPAGISPTVVRAWVVSLKAQGLASSTIARHIYALRSIWRFLQDGELVDHDPLRRIAIPKRKQTLPTCLSADDARLLLEAAADHRDPVIAARDYAIFATFVFTGLRRSELLGLRLDDVMAASRSLHVRLGKGGKDRVIPALDEVLVAIETWLRVRPEAKHDHVFTTVCGNRSGRGPACSSEAPAAPVDRPVHG